jgi:predicted amidohydrolase
VAYDKQHLHAPEARLFQPGGHGASLRLDGVEVALSVCYDANFPEHAASAAADGAMVYVNSGAYFPGGAHRRDLHYAARALDNGIYVVFSALIGAPANFIGGSAIYDPIGRPLGRLGDEEGVVVADVDPETVAQVRADQRMWADRRSSLGVRRTRAL